MSAPSEGERRHTNCPICKHTRRAPVAEQKTEMENGRPLEEAFQLRIDYAVLRGVPVALSHDMARQITGRLREGRNEIARLRARPADGEEMDSPETVERTMANLKAIAATRQPTEAVAEALEELYRAADAYDADPVNAYDRPSSWGKLDALLESVAALRTLTEGPSPDTEEQG